MLVICQINAFRACVITPNVGAVAWTLALKQPAERAWIEASHLDFHLIGCSGFLLGINQVWMRPVCET